MMDMELTSVDLASFLLGFIAGMVLSLLPPFIWASISEWIDTRVESKAKRLFNEWKEEYEKKGEDGIE